MPIFQGLQGNALDELASSLTTHACRKGELIMKPGDEARIVLIGWGLVRMYRVSTAGKEITLREFRAGEVSGLAYLEPSIEPAEYLEATVDGTVVHSVGRRVFERLVASSPPLAMAVLRALAVRLHSSIDQIEDLALYGVSARLARALIRLVRDQGSTTLMTTHRELAWMIGTRQEEVTKALGQFRSLGLVAYEAHQPGITVIDMRRLAAHGDSLA